MGHSKDNSRGQKRRYLTIFTPLLLLISCFCLINVVPGFMANGGPSPRSTPTEVALTAVDAADGVTAVARKTPSLPLTTATLSPTASPTPYHPPVFPADATIQLLGPPDQSAFSAQDSLSFYWAWPLTLTEDQQFSVYIFVNEETLLLGQVTEPNLGNNYRLHITPDTIRATEPFAWQVSLETTLAEGSLIDSEIRSVTLSPGN